MKADLSRVPRKRLTDLCEYYRSTLLDNVVPFWEKNSLDWECGGYFNCLERDGHVWSTDKFMWMTGREIWMFSHLFNHYERRPQWLDAARLGADFTLQKAFLAEGKMYFRLTRQGRPLSKALSVFSELFAGIGLAELSRATGNEQLWQKALAMYNFMVPRFGQPSDTALLCYPLDAQFHLHSHDMCRITAAWVFNEVHPSRQFEDDLTLSVESIVGRHWKPELSALLENVAMDGSAMLDLPEGRMFHPGHALESAWMVLEIARQRNEEALARTAVDIMLASLEHGWDREYGGIRYITNIDWTPTHELGGNLKLWWVHSETLYALLLAWSVTGRDDLWQWFEKVHDYSFGHFADTEFGEWYGYLDRDGKPVWTAKGTAWKCFFHLPRALSRCHQLLKQIISE